MNLYLIQSRNRLTDLENKLSIAEEFETDVYTLLYLKWITNNVLLYSIGNSVQCYVAAWIEGEFGGEWKCVYV